MTYIPPVYTRGGKWYHSHCGEEYGPFDTRGAAEMAQALHFDAHAADTK